MKKITVGLVILAGGFLLTEIMLRAFYVAPQPEPMFRVNTIPSVRQAAWFDQWSREHDQLKRTFRAYEIYGLRPFTGRHIRIGHDGNRWNSNPRGAGYQVGLFGGSTMWGGFARDNHTIPGELSSRFQQAGRAVRVTNYGQIGFVFSQEFHQAMRILYETENPPNVMIFMDGICDVLATLANFTHGVRQPAGKPWEFEKYEYLFRLGNTGEVSWGDVAKKFKVVRQLLRLAESYGLKRPDRKTVFIKPGQRDYERMADQVAKAYLRLVRVAHQTLKGNQVRPVFILQPAIFEKSPLSPEESATLRGNGLWQAYAQQAYRKILAGRDTLPADVEFWDFSSLFRDRSETLYADVMHYTESGNRLIARELYRRLAGRQPLARREPNPAHGALN